MNDLPAQTPYIILFMLEHQTYALAIDPLIRIAETGLLKSIGDASSPVIGGLEAAGVIVPAIDMRCHLGLPEISIGPHVPVLLMNLGAQVVGLIVDEVIAVLRLPMGPGENAPRIYPGTVIETLSGRAVLLDYEHLFSPEQLCAIERAASLLQPAREFGQDHGAWQPAQVAAPQRGVVGG